MARSHTHREGGPVCRFETKRECDEFFREHQKQAKEEYNQKAIAKAAAEKARRIKVFDDFIASEAARAASYDSGTRIPVRRYAFERLRKATKETPAP